MENNEILRSKLKHLVDTYPNQDSKYYYRELKKLYPDYNPGRFRVDYKEFNPSLKTSFTSNSYQTKIDSREKELKNLEKIEKDLQKLLRNPVKPISPENQIKVYQQLQLISGKKIKLVDEIQKEKELLKSSSRPRELSTEESLKQELTRKKLEEAEIKINKLQDNLIAKDELEKRWSIITKELSALVKTFQRSYGKDSKQVDMLISTLKSINHKISGDYDNE